MNPLNAPRTLPRNPLSWPCDGTARYACVMGTTVIRNARNARKGA